MFKQDLEVIDALRRDAVNVREPHPSGIKKLQTYAAQLVWVGGKFPIDVSFVTTQHAWLADRTRLEPTSPGILRLDTIPNGRWYAITSSTSS